MRPFIPFRDPGLEAIKAVAEFAMIVGGMAILLILSPIIVTVSKLSHLYEYTGDY